MDKLELKHLAPYLPYGLKITGCDTPMNGRMCELIAGKYSGTRKPILRPMSDLDKEIEGISGVQEVMTYADLGHFRKYIHQFGSIALDVENMEYEDVLILLQNHFDVFGLIDKGLAIDINTLTNA